MVAYIGSAPQGSSGFQTVYLADTDFNILGLAFWGGVQVFSKLEHVMCTSGMMSHYSVHLILVIFVTYTRAVILVVL